MTQLRSLRLAGHWQSDLRPFASLVLLEHLEIGVDPEACSHCVPLHRLSRLRVLHLTNGYVCDLVGYLPRLETLVWGYVPVFMHFDGRLHTTLYRRKCRQLPRDGKRRHAQLRRLVLCGELYIDARDVAVREMLAHVEHVELYSNVRAERVLEAIAQLRHLKRLAFQNCRLPWVHHARDRTVAFASAETLEELFVMATGLADQPAAAPLPLWFGDRLPNLRVLASPFQESMSVLARLCPRLTHVSLPFSLRCAFWRTRRASLRRLCVVTLALEYDCAWLRRARGRWGALPSLRQIFHPTTDCLCTPVCCQRRVLERGTVPSKYEGFVKRMTLRPAWRYDWRDPWEATEWPEMEQFHRLALHSV